MREKVNAESRSWLIAGEEEEPEGERILMREGSCSVRIPEVISGEQDSTAAENVCRRHTQATVGSPSRSNVNYFQ